MASIYAAQVEGYGRQWQRPWLALLVYLTSCVVLHWLMRGKPEERQVVCEHVKGKRFQAAVEIDGLVWTADLKAALACGAKHDRRVLLAFHAITDFGARSNEIKIFGDKRVKLAMRRYVLVKLYTDVVPDNYYQRKPDREDRGDDADANLKFEEQRFYTVQEPLYAVLAPNKGGDFEIVGVYDEAVISDPTRFIQFLSDPQKRKLE